MYGAFVLRSGKWRLVMSSDNKADCEREVEYQICALGEVAKLFKKV